LTKAVETIISKDSGAPLRKRIAELKAENSWLKATTDESAEMISMLQRAVDIGVEDYKLLMEGNKSLLGERNDFCYRCEDLKVELADARSNAEKGTADLEVKVRSTEAHIINVVATGEKWLRDLKGGLIRDLAKLSLLYVHNTQTIGGSCSPMPEGEPSVS
jgi:hypothetical protein